MAINVEISKITGINQVGNSYQRKSAVPLDYFSLFNSKAAAEEYAKNNPVSYVGQFLAYTDNNNVVACVIGSAAGDLIQLAQATATGDIAADLNAAVNRIAANEAAIEALQGLATSLRTDLDNGVARIQPIETAIGNDDTADTIKGRLKQLETVVAGLRSDVDKKVASVKAADKSVTIAGTATDPTVAVALSTEDGNNLLLKNDGLYVQVPEVVHPEYTVVKAASADEGFAATYQLAKNGEAFGTKINIPRDMVISSGTVEKYAEDDLPKGVTEAGTYIVLTIANKAEDKLYIPADELLDFDEVLGSEGTTIKVTTAKSADGSVTVSAEINSGSVATVHLADSAVTTAKIADKNVTKAKLSKDVQDSLDLADSAIQEVTSGAADGTIAVDGIDVSVTGLKSAAFVETESTLADDAKLPTGAAVTAAIASAVSDACSVYRFEE